MFYKNNNNTANTSKGFFLVLVLVLGAVFFAITSAFIGYIVTQSQVVQQRYLLDQSSDIAEAGLNYYKWFLAHYPNDVTNGTGLPGPYVQTYYDPEDGPIGEYSLALASTTYCGDVASIEVSSTGYTYADPTISRTITARYAQPTVAEYAFIINSSVWAGADRTIVGPYHSNQGIRMDGTNQSTVTSGLEDWTCTSSFGCSPNQTVDGVFTTTVNANPLLFSFPSSPINFTDLTIDLAQMKDRAENSPGGISVPASGVYGYQVVFNGDDTVTFRPVTNTHSYTASNSSGDFTERNIIRSLGGSTTYTIDNDCPLLFVEDKLWLSGVVNQKVTIAAATLSGGSDPDIILQGNITYTDPATSGLLAIAEDDVLLGVDVPDDMTVNGIFVAQNGRYGRNHYTYSNLPNPWWSTNYKPYYERNSLTMNGTIVSNGRVGTKWTYSGGGFASGFHSRTNTYDRNLVENPPPLVPNTSDVYEFTEWREED